MNNKIISLFGDENIIGEPRKDVIATLEKTLAEAKRGEIDGIAIAISRPNDRVSTRYEFGSASFRLIAAVEYLRHDFMQAMDDVAISIGED